MFEAIFTTGVNSVTVNGLVQWDYGQKLKITGVSLPEISQVHFSHSLTEEAIVRLAYTDVDGNVTVDIPNELLRDSRDIIAWVFVLDDTTGKTIKGIYLPVISRGKPNDFVSPPDPSEEDLLKEFIAYINEVVEEIRENSLPTVIDKDGTKTNTQLTLDINNTFESVQPDSQMKMKTPDGKVLFPQTLIEQVFDIDGKPLKSKLNKYSDITVSDTVIILNDVDSLENGCIISFYLTSDVTTPKISISNKQYTIKDTNGEIVDELKGGVCHSLTYYGDNFFIKSLDSGGLKITNGYLKQYTVALGSSVLAGNFVTVINDGTGETVRPIGQNDYIYGVANENGVSGSMINIWTSDLLPDPVPMTDYDKFISGNAYKYFNVGDTITLPNNAIGERTYEVIAKGQDGENTLTFVTKSYISAKVKWGDDSNYETSNIRNHLNSTVLTGFDSAVQNVIQPKPKICHNGATEVTLNDKIWVLGASEIYPDYVGISAPYEGELYSVFDNDKRVTILGDGGVTRTPYIIDPALKLVYTVNDWGGMGQTTSVTYTSYYSFAFVIK